MTPEFILQLIVVGAAGFGAYAAIRADLARLHEKAAQAEKAADEAHGRLDRHLENHHGAKA